MAMLTLKLLWHTGSQIYEKTPPLFERGSFSKGHLILSVNGTVWSSAWLLKVCRRPPVQTRSHHPRWRWEPCGGSVGWPGPPQMGTPPFSMSWTHAPAAPTRQISRKTTFLESEWRSGGSNEARATRTGDRTHLKVDVAAGQPIGASFIKEVNVFDQQTEEGNHNLRKENYVGNIEMKMKAWIAAPAMRVCALPALCCCWQCGSDGQPPSERSCSYKSFL